MDDKNDQALTALNRVAFTGKTWKAPDGHENLGDNYTIFMGDVHPRLSFAGNEYFKQLTAVINQATGTENNLTRTDHTIAIPKTLAENHKVIEALMNVPIISPPVKEMKIPPLKIKF